MKRWSTPQRIFDRLDAEFSFERDLCADHDNAKCAVYLYAPEALATEWRGVGFLNPPYGREISDWLRKAFESSRAGATVVCLIPGRTNAPWWHDFVMRASEIRFVKRKVSFVEPGGKKGVPPYGSVVVVFRPGDNSAKCSSWDWRQA